MSDSTALVCYGCKFVLGIGEFSRADEPGVASATSGLRPENSPVATRALWKFLGQHVGHSVEILGEASLAWERIDIDFTQTDSDIDGDPTLAEYAHDAWRGEGLALRPRPVANAVGEAVLRATDLADGGAWRPGEQDAAAAQRLVQSMDFHHPAGTVVDDADVLARLTAVRGTLDDLRRAAELPLGESFSAFLRECLVALADTDLSADKIFADSGPLAAPPLFDAERALRLVQGFLHRVAP